jgi:hypothetical protein
VLVVIGANDPRGYLLRRGFTRTDNPFIGQAVAPEKPNADTDSSRKTRRHDRFI